MNYRLSGSTRCKYHGGSAPKGQISKMFKHGRYSKDLPTRMQADFRKAQEDPHRLSIGPEISLFDVRIAELTKRLETGESGDLWEKLHKAWEKVEEANTSGDTEKFSDAMQEVGRIIKRGNRDEKTWHEIFTAIKGRTNLARAEHGMLKDLHQMMSLEQAMTLIGKVVGIIVEEVRDREEVVRVGRRIEREVVNNRGGKAPGWGEVPPAVIELTPDNFRSTRANQEDIDRVPGIKKRLKDDD